MDLERIRNFGVAAHIDAGKTTVSERMLFHSGVERRAGAVDEGTATMDWMAEERERGITITSAATRLPWRDHDLNLIDTPGHVDFTVEVERCMRVLDGAVLVLDAVVGVQAQSETVWRQMVRHRVPAIAFVNKLDRPGADYPAAVETLRTRLDAPGICVQYPIVESGDLTRIVDLLSLQVYAFPQLDDGLGRDLVVEEEPTDIPDEALVLRSELLDALADDDEEIMTCVLEDREPALEHLQRALRARVLARTLVPVLCGVALRDVGVRPLPDAVVDYLPSPLDVPPIVGHRPKDLSEVILPHDPDGPPCALVFKLHTGPHGDLSFARIYSGTLTPGMSLLNPRTKKRERIARILRLHADSHQGLDEGLAGDIVAFTGLKSTGTGDTLCSEGKPVLLESVVFPEPVITRVVEPESGAERDKLRLALERLAHEDPSFHAREEENGQWVVGGMGELHLEVIEHRLQTEFKLSPRVGQPRVAYREAVVATVRGCGEVERAIGGKEVYARVEVEITPESDSVQPRVDFEEGVTIPEKDLPAVREALLQEAQVGPRFGYPMASASIRVLSSATREGKESDVAYVQAAVSALRQAMPADGVVLEEPLMDFEIQTPAEFSSGIIADLNSRRAELSDVGAEGETRTIRGAVPLAAMFGYSTAVRSLSQGRAGFSMSPSGFRPVPESELEARGLVWR